MSCNCTSTVPVHSCAPGTTGLERVNYFPRQIMTVEDMVMEAKYFREKLRRHNRYLHGWGVVCGLDVTPAPTKDAQATVSISGGYALGPYGDEIYVADPVILDLSRCGPGAATDPCEPDLLHSSTRPGEGATVFVAIRYSECLAKPVRAMPAGCACEEEDCEYSRVRDSFELSCRTELPQDPNPDLLCDLRGKPVLCPPDPSNPWIVLAQVTLPVGRPITQKDIVTTATVRRQLFSTSQIQAQIIDCCCDKTTQQQPQPLLQVADVILRGPNIADIDVKSIIESNSPFFDPEAVQLTMTELEKANTIEVKFSRANLDTTSVSNENFKVVDDQRQEVVSGSLKISADSVTWTARDGSPFGSLDMGNGVDFTLMLTADPVPGTQPITSTEPRRLDGEFLGRFPSGDGNEGGDFKLNFHAS